MDKGTAQLRDRQPDQSNAVPRRRLILGGAGGLTMAALALPGCTADTIVAQPVARPSDDAALLANLIGLEYGAIGTYDSVLAGPLLGAAERRLATDFRGDHRQHVEALLRALERLGST